MYYNFTYCIGQNIWKLIIDNKNLWNNKQYQLTVCLHNFTHKYARYPHSIISGTLYLRYYAGDKVNPGNVSNYLLCTEDEQIKYLNLCKEIVDFEYKISHRCNKYYNNTRCLIINFKECNYTKFMLILTLIRYTYEFPASKFISDVLKFYDYLNGKENIINCIHCVFKSFQVTHGHQTQTIFPYLDPVMPYFNSKENLQNLWLNETSLFSIFPSWNLPKGCVFFDNGFQKEWDSKVFEDDFSKRLYEYLNVYNICKLKSM